MEVYCDSSSALASIIAQHDDKVKRWDKRFIDLARYISTWSKDPSTKTGAVITNSERHVVSVGYNGFAKGVDDSPERYADRELKYKIIVHCERNAILFAHRGLRGCTLYTWPFMSCATCAAMVIQAGIARVVAPISDNPRWVDDFKLSTQMFKEGNVRVVLYDLSEKSSTDGQAVKGTDSTKTSDQVSPCCPQA